MPAPSERSRLRLGLPASGEKPRLFAVYVLARRDQQAIARLGQVASGPQRARERHKPALPVGCRIIGCTDDGERRSIHQRTVLARGQMLDQPMIERCADRYVDSLVEMQLA